MTESRRYDNDNDNDVGSGCNGGSSRLIDARVSHEKIRTVGIRRATRARPRAHSLILVR